MADEQTRYSPVAARLRKFYEKNQVALPEISDYELIQQALKDESGLVRPQIKDSIRKDIGADRGAGSSFAKGFGRGLGLDLALGAYDWLTGSNTADMLEDPSEHWIAGTAGNLAGTAAGLVTPTGLAGLVPKAAKVLSKAPTAIRAGIAGWQGASQSIGTQRDQIERGQREEVDALPAALQGGLAGAAFYGGESWLRPLANAGYKAAAKRAVPLLAGEGLGGAVIEDVVANQSSSLSPAAREELKIGPEGYLMATGLGAGLGAAMARPMARGAAQDYEFFTSRGKQPPPPAPVPAPPAPTTAASQQFQPAGSIFPAPAPRYRTLPPEPELPGTPMDDFTIDEQPFIPGFEPPRIPSPSTPPRRTTPQQVLIDEYDVTPGRQSLLEELLLKKGEDLKKLFEDPEISRVPYLTRVQTADGEKVVTVVPGPDQTVRFVDQETGKILQEGDKPFAPTAQPRRYQSWGGIKDLEVAPGVEMQIVPGRSGVEGLPTFEGQLKNGGTVNIVGRKQGQNELEPPLYYAQVNAGGGVNYGFVFEGDLLPADQARFQQLKAEAEQRLNSRNRKPVLAEPRPVREAESQAERLDQLLLELQQYIAQRRPNQ